MVSENHTIVTLSSVSDDDAAAQLSDGKSASALLSVQCGGGAPVHVAAGKVLRPLV